MGWSKNNSRQQTLALPVIVREPSREDLQAAYERCVQDQARLPFERALALPAIALAIKNAARAAIVKRGGI